MRRIIICLLLVTSLTIAKGQSSEIDSLSNQLKSSSEDSSKVLTLLLISRYYYYSNPDTALQFAKLAFNLSRKLKFKLAEQQSRNLISNILGSSRAQDYIQILEYKVALKMAEQAGDEVAIGAAHNNLAYYYSEKGEYQNALYYLFKAKNIFEKLKLTEYILITLLNIGDNYEKWDKLGLGLKYDNMAYKLALRIRDKDNIGTILSNLGNVYRKLGNRDTAFVLYRSGLILAGKIIDKPTLAEAKHGLSSLHDESGHADSAIWYARESLADATDCSYSKAIKRAYLQLAKLFLKYKQTDSATLHFKKAISLHNSASKEEIDSQEEVSNKNQPKQKEQTDNIQKSEKQNDSLKLAKITVGLVLVFVFIYIMWKRRNIHG